MNFYEACWNKTAKSQALGKQAPPWKDGTFVPREHCCCWHSSKRRNMFILYLTLHFLHRLQSEFSFFRRQIYLTTPNFRNPNSPAVKCRSPTFHIIRSVWGKKEGIIPSSVRWSNDSRIKWVASASRRGGRGEGGRVGPLLSCHVTLHDILLPFF